MTPAYIAFHAGGRPDAVAIVNDGREITYADFWRDIRKFTAGLRDFGLPRGAKVLIDCDDVYNHWLLRFAFERLGVITATTSPRQDSASLSFLRNFDLVLSERDFRAEGARRRHRMTAQWLQEIFASGDEDDAPALVAHSEDPLRILQTSGTTGTPKGVLYSRRIHDRAIEKVMWFVGFTHRSRYLQALPLGVGGPTACMRAGGIVIMERRMTTAEAITAHAITHTTLPPIALKQVLDELPESFVKPAELTILSLGARLSGALRDKAISRLASDVCDLYGSNEAGFVSSTRGTAEVGTVWPGVEVEIVDEEDRPLPYGALGRIRVRTDCMVERYLDDPDTTARAFRDGWFYAGDLGTLQQAGRLRVFGRSDDVLNIGWNKFSPEMLEDLVLKSASVGDVGVCAIANADGVDEIAVAVSDPRSSPQELLELITRAFGNFQVGNFNVLRVERIPRNANGKIERDRLKDVVAISMRTKEA
ncbi:MAG TPA: class I adenylate-forming enzyme family protein [Stellaceae bacterium]|nr:class I adenylate-forming enzyme family protein [Stellaceae bacterium]